MKTRTKSDKTAYQVEITGEQIMLIRSLVLRMDQMWIHNSVSDYVGENGTLETNIVYSCWFCRKASYDGVGKIEHDKKCIVSEVSEEFEKLNAQFIQVLSKDEQERHLVNREVRG